MDTVELLNESFRTIGMNYGYDSVTAEYCEFKEFKIKWRRSCGWAEFDVSDYMMDAPPEVMRGMADTIFSKIARKVRKNYPKEMLDWLTADEFIEKKQPLYMSRARNLTRTAVGEHVDLNEAYRRLVDMGLTNFDKNLRITWTRQPNTHRVGYCSVLMKVVIISSVFDSPSIPTLLSDYVLYHELIHLSKGFDPFGQRHGIDFHSLERMYPKREEAEEWLKRLHLRL
ncbi:MAG: hypothetical protein LBH69_00965 [Methanomassiliicoccaceae archaeon]|jgi:predicted metal-dependent hydrolase|nr:hypothetical protein [Methanomassiliicoccaceae archaeon]